jgi:hypothetical protein
VGDRGDGSEDSTALLATLLVPPSSPVAVVAAGVGADVSSDAGASVLLLVPLLRTLLVLALSARLAEAVIVEAFNSGPTWLITATSPVDLALVAEEARGDRRGEAWLLRGDEGASS